MPNRLPIPGPEKPEERRQIAESIADLHYTMATIVESADEFIPGEAVDEFKGAWNDVSDSMKQLVSDIIPDLVVVPSVVTSSESNNNPTTISPDNFPLPSNVPPPAEEFIKTADLERHQLIGRVGMLKRATLTRFKDRFFMFWNSSPRTEEAREKAREAVVEYLDFGAIFVSSIPGHEHVEEALSLGKKLIESRGKRGI
jgi:hypothetical protein